jgi:hypothetical protein
VTYPERPVHELRGCELLNHDVADRFVGDLVGRCCHTCSQVWFTDRDVPQAGGISPHSAGLPSAEVSHPDSSQGTRPVGFPRSSASRPLRGAGRAQPA